MNVWRFYLTTRLTVVLLIHCIACTVNTTEQSFTLESVSKSSYYYYCIIINITNLQMSSRYMKRIAICNTF